MRQTTTLSLPGWLLKKLQQVTRQEDVSQSDIVRTALQQFFARREFEVLRGRTMKQARSLGLYTDDDIFHRIS